MRAPSALHLDTNAGGEDYYYTAATATATVTAVAAAGANAMWWSRNELNRLQVRLH